MRKKRKGVDGRTGMLKQEGERRVGVGWGEEGRI